MLRGLCRTFYLLMAFFAVIGPAKASDTVRFCFNAWAPFAYQDKDQNKGISIDIIRAAALELNRKAQFIHLPWKRCLQDVRNGDIHAVIDAANREEFVQGPASFSLFTNTVWVHQDDPLTELPNLNILKAKTFGIVDGYEYPDEFMNIALIDFDLSLDDTTTLKKLSAQRVDFVVADITNTYATINQNNEKPLKIRALIPTRSADKLYLSFHKSQADVQKQFNRVFESFLENGTVDAIYQAHIGQTFTTISSSVESILQD